MFRVRRDEQRIERIERIVGCVFDRLRLNMCCCVLRRQDTSATDGCAENQINPINPLWEKYIFRVRRDEQRIERIERIRVGAQRIRLIR